MFEDRNFKKTPKTIEKPCENQKRILKKDAQISTETILIKQFHKDLHFLVTEGQRYKNLRENLEIIYFI